jgi:signal transduction histidine kinase
LEGALLNLEKVNLELKNTQSQLVQSEKMRALGQLVAGIAHEINNPSAFVANNLALLAKLGPAMRDLFEAYAPLKQFANNEQLEIINNAESQADIEYLWKDLSDLTHESINGIERIRNIVLSLRNFSRHDEALNKFADINEGLRNTLRLVYPSCKNRISIIEEYGEIPQIPCFPGELNQVFLNILNNAVQAIEGKGTIKIKTFQESNKIIIAISDTGSGMDPSTLQHLGEPFFTTKPIGEGTGLGLSISYEIIKHHQGNIYFKSEIGHGSTAFVEIPIQ